MDPIAVAASLVGVVALVGDCTRAVLRVIDDGKSVNQQVTRLKSLSMLGLLSM